MTVDSTEGESKEAEENDEDEVGVDNAIDDNDNNEEEEDNDDGGTE